MPLAVINHHIDPNAERFQGYISTVIKINANQKYRTISQGNEWKQKLFIFQKDEIHKLILLTTSQEDGISFLRTFTN